jgi:hypothetical protein
MPEALPRVLHARQETISFNVLGHDPPPTFCDAVMPLKSTLSNNNPRRQEGKFNKERGLGAQAFRGTQNLFSFSSINIYIINEKR